LEILSLAVVVLLLTLEEEDEELEELEEERLEEDAPVLFALTYVRRSCSESLLFLLLLVLELELLAIFSNYAKINTNQIISQMKSKKR
jgi:hypothetical protein